jgi:antitoxin YefM
VTCDERPGFWRDFLPRVLYSHSMPASTTHASPSSTTLPLTEVRDRLSEIVEDVNGNGTEWTITRHGRPVAVILGADEYEALIETLNILSDDDTMDAIAEATADIDEGNLSSR